ncbi:MAG: tRNA (adenosine(37)-N6)-dimethylallyltransferase MiaA [Candidatus Aphodosoma sp.]|nr:tRNA (adenosine(37)-N6)-dimethylallyltransferase MiaA [Candidatus Aphodosoma sp.]
MGNLFVVLGPTGVGKTDISIEIAQRLSCSIISSDSRQIYKEMSIGTAKPSEEELQKVKHYFISTQSITEHYSSGQYELDAIPIIESEIERNGNALLVGGSMLYIDAVCKGIDDIPNIEPNVREEVSELYERVGLDGIRNQLKLLDPVHYREVDPMNAKRIKHALEVCLQTGKPFSNLRTGIAKKRNFNIVKIGLRREREELYEMINRRVLKMVEAGLIEEARNLYAYRNLNSLNTVGYKELFKYFENEWTLDYAINMIQQNTRRYAKKQMSWFNKDREIEWFHPEDKKAIHEYISRQAQQ